jgi:hypothetical protein
MVRYFYAWTPLVIVGSILLLALPWLGLIALMIVALFALAAFAFVIVLVPYTLGRAIGHRWQLRTSATPRTAHDVTSAPSGPYGRSARASALH